MGSLEKRLVCALGTLLFIGLVGARPAFAQLPSPNQPILVVQDSTQTSAEPYQNFVPELMTAEGLNGFQTAQLPQLTASFLSNYKDVVLPHLTLTSAEATLFQNFVSAGGTLIGFRPDAKLATTFGVASIGTTLTEGWLAINTTTSIGAGLDPSVMKFHGTADLYSLNGASSLATLYSNATTATSSPAAAIHVSGSGQAILFSFDLPQTIVLMRQGNPAWAGYPNNHDGFNTMRPSQMFMDQNTDSYWNDLGNGALNDVPQADEEMRLFSNAMVSSTAAKLPLPRFWYFPNQNRAQLLMTGDDHAYTVSDALDEIANISSYGGLFSYNVWYPYGTVTNAQLNAWIAAGYSMGVHFNDIAEMDSSGVGGSHVTWNGMQSVMSSALASFATTYPTAPFPVTTRDHYLVWVSNDANGTVDQVAQAKLFQNFGVQMDTSYSSFPLRWGYMTGSGLPMKFLDPVAGTLIPVYEQATQYEDDIQLMTTAYGLDWSNTTAEDHYEKSLSDSLTKYNTVITMLNHPENWVSTDLTAVSAALQYAQSQSIPISTTGSWLSFWQGRAATTFSNPSFSANTLSFTVTGAPAGLTLLVPDASGSNTVSAVRVDGVYTTSYTVAGYQGISYASLILAAGSHSILVDYGTAAAYSISGTISGSGGNGATVTLSGAANATVTAGSNGAYTFTGVLNGSYTVTPTHTGFTFSPPSTNVTVNGANINGTNFTASPVPTYSISGTISGIGGETVTLSASGTTVATTTASGTGTYSFSGLANGSYTVTPKLAGYTFTPASTAVTVSGANMTGVNFTSAAIGPESLFTVQTPATTGNSDGTNVNYELGMLVQSDVAGQITGIRFWKDSKESGTHTGHIWSATGTLLATATFTNETASGWQVQNLSTPLTITANTTYVVSVNTGNTYYVATASGLASKITNLDLSSVVGANGVYGSTGAFPTNSYESSNYFRDVVFVAGGVSTYSISGTISGVGGATVTLSASGSTVATTTATGAGAYSFTGVENGNYTVTPTLASYAFTPISSSVAVNGANVSGVNFTAAAVTSESLFTTQTPATTGNSDGSNVNYELGTVIQSDIAGQITGIRFWKDSKETGTHTGHIWSATGTLLATVTFTNETASGWQLQSLTTPLTITASTDYVVSVNTGNTYYVATASGLASKITNLDLSSVVGADGVYGSAGAFPNNSYENSDYFRDVVFVPGQTYGISGSISGVGGATVTLSLSGTTVATTTASGAGAYSFNGVANGTYTVTPTLNGYSFSPTSTSVPVSGASVSGVNFAATTVPTYTVSGTISGVGGATVTLSLSGTTIATTIASGTGAYSFGSVANGNYTVTPTLALYTFSPTGASAPVNGANVSGVNFTASEITSESLFTTQTPVTTGNSDGTNVNYELGMLVQSDVAGHISGIRFWKDSKETGTHTGHIWSSTGTLLATVTFTNETASGWQVQNLTTPLAITANTTYVVSVNTGNTYYVATNSGLASKITNEDLSSVVGANGVYGSTGAFPTSSYQNSNYFRDVVFGP